VTAAADVSRADAKRTRVLTATLRLLARGGPRAVTHRAVAAEAGTSLRATTYYFASREELLREAFLHYAEGAIARIEALEVPLPEDPAQALEAAAQMLAETVLSDLMEDRVGLVAEYEWVLEIGRSPSLEASYGRFQSRLVAMLRTYGEKLGTGTAQLDARIVLAALRGVEVEALAQPSTPPNREALVATFRRLLSALSATD